MNNLGRGIAVIAVIRICTISALLTVTQISNAQPAPHPLYSEGDSNQVLRVPPIQSDSDIVLRQSPASTVDDAANAIRARTAAAILYVVGQLSSLQVPRGQENPDCRPREQQIGGICNEEGFGTSLVARMAYQDYIADTAQPSNAYPDQVASLIRGEHAGKTGTSIDEDKTYAGLLTILHSHADYDMLLQSYVALYYKYYDRLPADVRDKLLNELMFIRGQYPFMPFTGLMNYPVIYLDFGFTSVMVPETENHILMIETARYLTNQVLFQREIESAATANPQHPPRPLAIRQQPER